MTAVARSNALARSEQEMFLLRAPLDSAGTILGRYYDCPASQKRVTHQIVASGRRNSVRQKNNFHYFGIKIYLFTFA